jgi:hypothetical protein
VGGVLTVAGAAAVIHAVWSMAVH